MTTAEQQIATDVERFLNFSLAGEEYALPLAAVKEVIALPDITAVPYTPPHFLGIMNLRGQVISVMDLRLKLNVKSDKSQETAVIICESEGHSIGMVVSSVNSVLALSTDHIAGKPSGDSSKRTAYLAGVLKTADKLILLMDIDKVLGAEEKAAMNKVVPIQRTV